jgi:hypothetical protein
MYLAVVDRHQVSSLVNACIRLPTSTQADRAPTKQIAVDVLESRCWSRSLYYGRRG